MILFQPLLVIYLFKGFVCGKFKICQNRANFFYLILKMLFDVFQVLLDTNRPSMATYNYNRLVLTRSDGYASTVGVMIFIIIFIFTVLYVRFVGIERE